VIPNTQVGSIIEGRVNQRAEKTKGEQKRRVLRRCGRRVREYEAGNGGKRRIFNLAETVKEGTSSGQGAENRRLARVPEGGKEEKIPRQREGNVG